MSVLAEKSKIAVRNIRREANETLKKEHKDKTIGEDELKNNEKKIQNATDKVITDIDKKLEQKEKEVMTI